MGHTSLNTQEASVGHTSLNTREASVTHSKGSRLGGGEVIKMPGAKGSPSQGTLEPGI